MQRAKLVKLGSLDIQKEYPPFSHIEIGSELDIEFNNIPALGDNFIFYIQDSAELRYTRTTSVLEINDRIFKTKNSTYQLTTISDERDDKY